MKNFKLKLKKLFSNHDWKLLAKIITIFLLFLLIGLDQLTKYLVREYLPRDVEKPFLPGFISFKYVINFGSAFGFNQNKTAMLIAIAFVVAFVLIVWWVFSQSTVNIVAVTFILAGTLGNLIDRFLFSGGVIDFFQWDLFKPQTIFNVADIMVTIGIITIVVNLIVEFVKAIIYDRKEKKEQLANEQRIKKN